MQYIRSVQTLTEINEKRLFCCCFEKAAVAVFGETLLEILTRKFWETITQNNKKTVSAQESHSEQIFKKFWSAWQWQVSILRGFSKNERKIKAGDVLVFLKFWQNFSERQIFWSLCSVVFLALTLKFLWRLKSKFVHVQVKNVKISGKQAHLWGNPLYSPWESWIHYLKSYRIIINTQKNRFHRFDHGMTLMCDLQLTLKRLWHVKSTALDMRNIFASRYYHLSFD